MEVDRRRRRRYRLEGQRQGVCAIAGRTAPLVLPIVDVGALGILVRVPKALTPDWPGLGHLGPATLLFDGELVVQDTYGEQRVKLPAGHAVIYPGTSVHRVAPVTRGARVASFFWIESMVRSDEQRRLLFDMDMALLALRRRHGETAEATRLTGTYHNLLRLWAST